MDEQGPSGDQAVEGRLRPAEMHDVIRRQLDLLVIPWGLRPVDVSHLAGQMGTHTYSPGEIILPLRARADFWGLITTGRAGAYADQRGTGQQVTVLLPGSTFGDDMLGGNGPSDLMLKALTRCEVRFLRRADLEEVSSRRRSRGTQKLLAKLAGLSTIVLLLCLAATLALSLSPARQFVALAPMGLGQLCSQWARGDVGAQVYEPCAVQAWTWARGLAPDDANPPLALGTFYFRQGQLDLAEQSFEEAKALAPDWAEIYNNLGLIHAEQGDHEKAITAFRQALELEPGTSAIEHNLGLSLQAIRATDEALTHYRQAVAFGDPQPSTLINMAIGYYETGQSAKAAAAAQQVLRNDDTSAPAYTVLGAVELEAQQLQLALAHLSQAVALDASYSQAHFYLGLAYDVVDQPAEAIAALERALATAEDEEVRSEIRRHLSRLHEMGK